MAENIDPERLRELEEQFKRLNEVLGSTYNGMDTVTKSLIMSARERDKLIEKNLHSSKVEDQKIAATMMATRAYEQQLTQLGLVKNELGEFQRVTVKLTAAQKERIAQERVAAKVEEEKVKQSQAAEDLKVKFNTMAANKMSTLVDGLSAFGSGLNKTLFDSTKGQGKYGDAMSGFGDSVISATKDLGPLGKAAGLAAGGLFKLVGAAFKQQEQLNKSYEKLSEFGAVDVSGIGGMFKNLQDMGMTVAEIDKFGDVLKRAAPNLATLGTTVADGSKIFAESMGKIKNTGVERELRQLGFTSETMAKTFADYQGMMGRQGFIQGKSTTEIAKQSAEYAKTLDQLAKLTGESRDELQKRMDADANDIKFRLKLQEVDEETRKRLQKASALVGEFSEDTASGFREMVANNGKVVGEASTKLMLSTGNAAKEIVEKLNSGAISATEAARQIAEAKAKQVERFREIGKLDADIMKELGLTAKDMDAINKYRGKTQEQIEKMDKDSELQAKGTLDRQRAAEVARQMTERNLEQSKDRLINIVGTKMVGAFETLMKMVNNVAKQLAHFAKWLGGPDFTDLFDTPEDIKKQLESAEKELVHAEKSAAAGPVTAGLTGEEAMAAQAEYDDQQRKLQEKRDKVAQLKERYKSKVAETGEEAESPEQQKLRKEAEKLAKERLALEEQIEDKSKLIYNQVLKQFEGGEEALKDAKKREEFDKKLTEAKAKYVQRQDEIDKRLIKIGEESQAAKKKELDKTLPSSAAGAAAKGPDSSGAGATGAKGGAAPAAKPSGGTSSEATAAQTKLDDILAFGSKSGSKENFDALSGDFKDKIVAAATEYNSATGKKIKINSAKRDTEDQQRVWDESVEAGRPGRGPTGMPIAKPGSSKHERGQAVDIQNYSDSDAVTAMNKQGLFQTVPKDPVHFELPKAEFGGVFSGPKSGYPVLMHGKEAVIPMPKLGELASPNAVSKTELGQTPNALSGSSNSAMDQLMTIQTDLMNMIANKLDQLDNRLAKSNDIQENILTYSAA